jgi:hypothetical protein
MNKNKNPYGTYGTDKITAPNKPVATPAPTKTVGNGDLRGGKKA